MRRVAIIASNALVARAHQCSNYCSETLTGCGDFGSYCISESSSEVCFGMAMSMNIVSDSIRIILERRWGECAVLRSKRYNMSPSLSGVLPTYLAYSITVYYVVSEDLPSER